MTLGALLALAGLVQTTSSTGGGNQPCPSGTVLLSKYNADHGYVFEKPAGNEGVVTLSHTSSSGGDWQSTLPVAAVIVKGGPASVLVTITPPQYDGSFSNAGLPLVGHGNHPAISNVQFCGPGGGSTTSTSSTSTSSTSSTSTTSTTVTTPPPTEPTTTTSTTVTTPPPTEPTTTTSTTSTTTTTKPPTEPTEPTEPTTSTSIAYSGESSTTSSTTSTTLGGQGSTTSTPYVTSTSLVESPGGRELPFTGSDATPLIALGIVLLATGLAITLSESRRRTRARS